MIIKRKLFTRQEVKAAKEIFHALKNGNVGRNLSAKDFVKARRVSNETIDYFFDNAKIEDYAKNSEIIKNIGLPETGKAYKKMLEKYNNPELHERFKKIQKLKRGDISNLDDQLNYAKKLRDKTGDIIGEFSKVSNNLERNKQKDYGKGKRAINEAMYNLKKKGIKISKKSKNPTSYSTRYNTIYLNKDKKSRRSLSSLLHESGHEKSGRQKEISYGSNLYNFHKNLDTNKNTSDNLNHSLLNNLANLSTLTEEANASYHAASMGNKLRVNRKVKERGKRNLSNAFRTYELSTANRMVGDEFSRTIGKLNDMLGK